MHIVYLNCAGLCQTNHNIHFLSFLFALTQIIPFQVSLYNCKATNVMLVETMSLQVYRWKIKLTFAYLD